MVSVTVRYLLYQPMDEKIKTCFPAKENSNVEKALFDWPIVLQYDVKTKYRLLSRKLSGMTFFTKSHARLYPSDKQMKSIYFRSFVSVLFVRVFISRSYENRSTC